MKDDVESDAPNVDGAVEGKNLIRKSFVKPELSGEKFLRNSRLKS